MCSRACLECGIAFEILEQAIQLGYRLQSSGPEWVLSDSSLSADKRPNSELLESAKRVWPRISSYVRRQFNGEISADERDRLAVETWEAVLRSISKTLARRNKTPISILDLDAYLV